MVVLALAVRLAALRGTLPVGGAADLNVALNTGVDETDRALPSGEPDDDWREIGGGSQATGEHRPPARVGLAAGDSRQRVDLGRGPARQDAAP